MRVLFVGNSFTASNSMPELVGRLAAGDEGAKPIFAVRYAAPGWSLRAASEDGALTSLSRDVDWDVVVLQEKSWVLAASVFFAVLSGRNPVASGFTAGLRDADARLLRRVAWHVAMRA